MILLTLPFALAAYPQTYWSLLWYQLLFSLPSYLFLSFSWGPYSAHYSVVFRGQNISPLWHRCFGCFLCFHTLNFSTLGFDFGMFAGFWVGICSQFSLFPDPTDTFPTHPESLALDSAGLLRACSCSFSAVEHLHTSSCSIDSISAIVSNCCSFHQQRSLNMGFALSLAYADHSRGRLFQSFSFGLVKSIFGLLRFALRERPVWMLYCCSESSLIVFFHLHKTIVGNRRLLSHSFSAGWSLEIWRFFRLVPGLSLQSFCLGLPLEPRIQLPAKFCASLWSVMAAFWPRFLMFHSWHQIFFLIYIDLYLFWVCVQQIYSSAHHLLACFASWPEWCLRYRDSSFPFSDLTLLIHWYCKQCYDCSMVAFGFLGLNRN